MTTTALSFVEIFYFIAAVAFESTIKSKVFLTRSSTEVNKISKGHHRCDLTSILLCVCISCLYADCVRRQCTGQRITYNASYAARKKAC